MDDALGDYAAAIRLVPKFAAALNNRGNVLRSLGRLPDARRGLPGLDAAEIRIPNIRTMAWARSPRRWDSPTLRADTIGCARSPIRNSRWLRNGLAVLGGSADAAPRSLTSIVRDSRTRRTSTRRPTTRCNAAGSVR